MPNSQQMHVSSINLAQCYIASAMEWWLLATRINTVLSLLARVRGGQLASRGLAGLLRRVVLEVQEIRSSAFAPGSPGEYQMIQVWVRNALPIEIQGVIFDSRWTLDNSLLDVRTEPGVWMGVLQPDMANFSLGTHAEVDLPSNGAVQHAGLAVKYRQDADAYIVTPVGHHRLRHETGNWRTPQKALPPGTYNVAMRFRARGGKRAEIALRVTNPGAGHDLMCELLSGHFSDRP
jgi:hypothetical protein